MTLFHPIRCWSLQSCCLLADLELLVLCCSFHPLDDQTPTKLLQILLAFQLSLWLESVVGITADAACHPLAVKVQVHAPWHC